MKDVSKHLRPPAAATNAPSLPAAVDRAAFQAELDTLRLREKAHTHEGDAIAAARRRLPMVEVDAATPVVGAAGEVPLIDTFEGRLQLIAYYFMWHTGLPAADQCEGCTFNTSHVLELSYLHSRDVTFAVFCQGPYDESARYRDFMGWELPWYSMPSTSVDALIAGCYFGMKVCYLRDGDRVFETYWTSGRGNMERLILIGIELFLCDYALERLTLCDRGEQTQPVGQGASHDCLRKLR